MHFWLFWVYFEGKGKWKWERNVGNGLGVREALDWNIFRRRHRVTVVIV